MMISYKAKLNKYVIISMYKDITELTTCKHAISLQDTLCLFYLQATLKVFHGNFVI